MLFQDAITLVTIHVNDSNDNRPEFSVSGYVFSVSEEQGEDVYVGRVQAYDSDIGLNADVEYSIMGGE